MKKEKEDKFRNNKEKDIEGVVAESIEKEESDKKLINKINEERKQFKDEIKNKNNPIDKKVENFYKRRERNEREEKAKAGIVELIKDELKDEQEINSER